MKNKLKLTVITLGILMFCFIYALGYTNGMKPWAIIELGLIDYIKYNAHLLSPFQELICQIYII